VLSHHIQSVRLSIPQLYYDRHCQISTPNHASTTILLNMDKTQHMDAPFFDKEFLLTTDKPGSKFNITENPGGFTDNRTESPTSLSTAAITGTTNPEGECACTCAKTTQCSSDCASHKGGSACPKSKAPVGTGDDGVCQKAHATAQPGTANTPASTS
jgi:hypothetical protein